MNNTADNGRRNDKMQQVLFITGLAAIIIGTGILGFFGARKIHREYLKQQLMRENPVVEITDLDIKAPVLEGTDSKTISRAVGHFSGTGGFGSGNYCIAGHSSTIYKEYFNDLKHIMAGMEIRLQDREKRSYTYTVKDSFIVDPDETWVLDDFGDDRITLITCTDDGKRRQVVVGLLEGKMDKRQI